MTKRMFMEQLRQRLSGLPQEDLEERLSFYGEMIDDRMEEGRTEEEAVSDIGSVDGICAQIIGETPLTRIAGKRFKPGRALAAWEIVLLILGSPIWFSLVVAAFSVAISLYAVLWSVVISLWAVFAALIGCAVGGITACFILIITINSKLPSAVLVGAGLICAGLSILMFFGCRALTKAVVLLTRKIIFAIKKRLTVREVA